MDQGVEFETMDQEFREKLLTLIISNTKFLTILLKKNSSVMNESTLQTSIGHN